MSTNSSRVSDQGNKLNHIIDLQNSNVQSNVKEKVKEKLACNRYLKYRGCIIFTVEKEERIVEEIKGEENVRRFLAKSTKESEFIE
jgi:hypothetical protein